MDAADFRDDQHAPLRPLRRCPPRLGSRVTSKEGIDTGLIFETASSANQ